MGNKTEEVEIEKELDDLDEQEIKINLEIYKLQKEINRRKPKDQQVKLKNNYTNIINKWKSKNLPEKIENKSKYDPFEDAEFERAKKEQKNWNKIKEQENKEKENIKKNKEHFLDSGIPKLKKRLKELENIDKEDEIYDVRRNKEKIKNDYIKELNQAEQDILEEDVKDDIERNIFKHLDIPDIDENIINDKMSELYNNDGNNELSIYEENYSNDYELYKQIVKDNKLKDKLYDINFIFYKPGEKIYGTKDKNGKKMKKGNKYGINYEYAAQKNEIVDKAIDNRNHIVKNKNILKKENSPYSENEQSEKISNISLYY